MKSTLIKDTTKSERIQLIKEWEETEGCESSGIDLMTYFKDYIDGVKEISEAMQPLMQDMSQKYQTMTHQ